MVQQAVITQIKGQNLIAELRCSDACGACAAKSLCGAEQKKELTLVADRPDRQVGEVVSIEVTQGAGIKAVALVYLVPVAVMLGVLIAGEWLSWAPWVSGLGALGAAGVYFLIVKLAGVGKEIAITIID